MDVQLVLLHVRDRVRLRVKRDARRLRIGGDEVPVPAWLMVTLLAMLVPPVALVLPLFIEIKTPGAVRLALGGDAHDVVLPVRDIPGLHLLCDIDPQELYEAAKIDGCDEYRTFWWVARPLARPLIATLAFFAFVGTWTNYFLPFVLLGKSENYTLPLGLGVLFSSTPALNPGVGASQLPIGRPEVALAGLLVAIPILVVFLLSPRFLVRGMLEGGVKQ